MAAWCVASPRRPPKVSTVWPGIADLGLFDEVRRIDAELEILHIQMNGDATIRRR